ncbi:MAG: radical SAM protein [Pseudomonadota bacterium]
MSEQVLDTRPGPPHLDPQKFSDPQITAKGEKRAEVALERLDTLWINTGTLCNIECINCYIESSPSNDRLVYFSLADALSLMDEIEQREMGTREIGFTGGEPFMNRDMMAMADAALKRGFEVLILTNAMQPMQRPKVREGLLALREKYPTKLSLRISLDHYTQALHELERGPRSWEKALEGVDWLAENGFQIAVAGRTCWNETEEDARKGYARLIAERGWTINADDHMQLVLFPEMDAMLDVPEITTDCWDILGVKPEHMMCATSRMAVKRKGALTPSILPCTLLVYDDAFDMGPNLTAASSANEGMFEDGKVKLNHPHCARFCVLGGGSCTGT